MEKYTEIMNKLLQYQDLPDVELNEETISIYDLYAILRYKTQKLRDVLDFNDFIGEINENVVQLKKGAPAVGFVGKKCTYIMAKNTGTLSEIIFGFDEQINNSDSDRLFVYKDNDCDELYFDRYVYDREFVEMYFSRIMEICYTLEEFSILFGGGIGSGFGRISMMVQDQLFKIVLSCNSRGLVSLDISLVKGVDPDDVYNRIWLRRKTIAEYVKENSESLLKKIPVKVSSLNDSMKLILESYLNEQRRKILQKIIYPRREFNSKL